MNLSGLGIILTTTSSLEEAQKIALKLVELDLAGCVNFTPITSVYKWDGKLNQDAEWQLIIKTDLSLLPQIETTILELHSYDLPEIIAIPIINGSNNYLNWLKESIITC